MLLSVCEKNYNLISAWHMVRNCFTIEKIFFIVLCQTMWGSLGTNVVQFCLEKKVWKKMKRKSFFVGNSSLEFEAQLTAFRDLPGSLFLRCIFIRPWCTWPRCSNISWRSWVSIFCPGAAIFLLDVEQVFLHPGRRIYLRQQERKWK